MRARVKLVAKRHVTEPTFLDAHFAHALVADEGRGDRRSNNEAPRGGWRDPVDRRPPSDKRQRHLRGDMQGRLLEA